MDIDENQFKLYFRMAKNLAFNLPDEKDRVKASKWIKIIEDTTDANAKRTKFHVIQLLLLSLQRKELVGPFEKPPREDATLTSYKWSFQPSDIARLILRKEFERIGQPEVHVEMSGDLCEFVAYQEIPNFGTHFFYAFSPEHIQKWNNLDKEIIPKGLLNITVISSPDTSILRKSIMETLNKRGKDENTPEYLQMKNQMKTNLYTPAIDQSCSIISLPERTPDNRRNVAEPQTTGKKLFDKTMPAIELQEDRLARNKRSLVAKLPPRLKERLTKKIGKDTNLARTPDIFRKDAHNIKNFRKYKPEEFLLPKDERFRPAHEVFADLEYMAPENGRRLPSQRICGQCEDDKTPVQDLNDTQNAKDSFDRSFKRMQDERQPPERQPPVRRNELIERLEQLKSRQAQRVVFDDMDIDFETEEIAFDRFVWKELPEDDAEVTVLDNTEMLYDDIFGADQICDVNVLPSPRAIQELEQAEILLDTEMQLDDMFGEDQIANPQAVFKDVSIEGEKVVMPPSGFPEKGSYRVGKRLMALPGEQPIVQTYIEQTGNNQIFNESLLRNQDNTPPINDSMINKILDEKLRKYKPGENAVPRTYGPWATKFRTQIEKLERGEELAEEPPTNISFTEMELDILSDERQEQTRKATKKMEEQSKKSTKKLENLKTRYEKSKSRKQKRAFDQDLLEPYIYGYVRPDTKGLLDTSIEHSENLVPPLLKKICVCEKDPFESFEKQLDQSLQFFKDDSNQCADASQGQRVFLDSDFLNKRIDGELPADDSIIGDDEMVFDDLSGIDEYIPVKDVIEQYDDNRVSQTSMNGMEEMIGNLSSQSSQILPSAVDLSPGHRVRQTLDIVNKYRYKGSQNLPPSYEIPYTQLENESFPLSSDSECLDITRKSDSDIWDTGKMDEMEKRLDTLRQEAAAHGPRSPCPIEHDTPTREIVKKSVQASADVEKLRNRYKTLKQGQMNKQQQTKYAGTFKSPLPVLNKGFLGGQQSEMEDIEDLFDISEKCDSDIDDNSQIYDPTLKKYIPAQQLQDESMPDVDCVGDEIMQPQIVNSIYQSSNFSQNAESESASDIQRSPAIPVSQPQRSCETSRNISGRRNPTVCETGQQGQSQFYQKTPSNIPDNGARRRLVYEMTSETNCPRLSLNMSPRERIKLLIEQQPNVEVIAKPRKSEFSPTQFITKQIPKKPYQLEDETFPDECPQEDMYENLGNLAHALYIPTEAEQREIDEFENCRRMVPSPPGPQKTPPRRQQNARDRSPIGRTDVLPHEEGFKWLANYMPYEQQVGANRQQRKERQPQTRPDYPQQQRKERQQQSQLRPENPQQPDVRPDCRKPQRKESQSAQQPEARSECPQPQRKERQSRANPQERPECFPPQRKQTRSECPQQTQARPECTQNPQEKPECLPPQRKQTRSECPQQTQARAECTQQPQERPDRPQPQRKQTRSECPQQTQARPECTQNPQERPECLPPQRKQTRSQYPQQTQARPECNEHPQEKPECPQPQRKQTRSECPQQTQARRECNEQPQERPECPQPQRKQTRSECPQQTQARPECNEQPQERPECPQPQRKQTRRDYPQQTQARPECNEQLQEKPECPQPQRQQTRAEYPQRREQARTEYSQAQGRSEYPQQQSQRSIDPKQLPANQRQCLPQLQRKGSQQVQKQGPQQVQKNFDSANQKQQYQRSGRQGPNVPTTAKVDIVSERLKDKETIMRKTETVTKKTQPSKEGTFAPKKKQKLQGTDSGNIADALGPTDALGTTKISTQTRKMTSGAVGQCGRSLIEKSSMTVKKDIEKKCQKIVKASQVKYNSGKEQRTKEYTFASKK